VTDSNSTITVDRAALAVVASAATAFAVMLKLASATGRPMPRTIGTLSVDGGDPEPLEWTPETTAELERAVKTIRRSLARP